MAHPKTVLENLKKQLEQINAAKGDYSWGVKIGLQTAIGMLESQDEAATLGPNTALVDKALEAKADAASESGPTTIKPTASMTMGDCARWLNQIRPTLSELPTCVPLDTSGCTFSLQAAGACRGDCTHFIGLPGKHIPGKHDGPDDTVDEYGKPNGWCWSCWKSHQIQCLRAALSACRDALDQEDSHNRTINLYHPAQLAVAALSLEHLAHHSPC